MSKKRRVLAIAAGLVLALIGSWAFRDFLARRDLYGTAAGRYREYAVAYDPAGKLVAWTSCYGERWDAYTDRLMEDRATHHTDLAYRARRSAEFDRLARKYARAAAWPWRRMTLDPPLDQK